MQDTLFSDALEQLLAGIAPPAVVRAIEGGGSSSTLWAEVEASGFALALVPEAAGGAGIGLSEACAMFEACGRHVLPVPLAQTAAARALLAGAGLEAPAGAIALATRTRGDAPMTVTYGAVADWVLLAEGSMLRLRDVREAERRVVAGTLDAAMRWCADDRPACECPAPACGLRAVEAVLLAVQMAGAMRRLLQMTLAYANERQQFGRAIGKFQAIQHELAVMAQHAEAARMAARMACTGTGVVPDALIAAVAKARTSEAVVPVASIAHAVHGAIGIAAEHDLQLYTRRLHAWRAAAGSESYWQVQIGRALIDSGMDTPEFTRTRLSPAG